MRQYLLVVLVFTVLLFLWSGVTQLLPWGVPSAQKITVQSKPVDNEPAGLIKLTSNTLTQPDFDSTFNHRISTYTTDRTFSWIITQPLKTNYAAYFIGEIMTQLLVGILLTALLVLSQNYKIQRRLLLICIVGLVAWVATYGQLINWWGMPLNYAAGVGLNLLIGWLLTAFLVSRYILKSQTH